MANGDARFLNDLQRRDFAVEDADYLEPTGLYLGQGQGAVEVRVFRSPRRPTHTLLRNVWCQLEGGRGIDMVVVALYEGQAAVCGFQGEDPPVYLDADRSVVERVCRTALSKPSRHAAAFFLRDTLPHIDSELPGVRNEGLLTRHELVRNVPRRQEFGESTVRGQSALHERDAELLTALGYDTERIDDRTHILVTHERQRALALLLRPDEDPDMASDRLGGLSPVSYALALAERRNLPYVILLAGDSLRLHPVRDAVGVAQRGRVETFVEINLNLLGEDHAGYLWELFSSDALSEGGSFEEILASARDHALALGTRLRERIYDDVIPDLAMAVLEARNIEEPTADDLDETYQISMTVLFRLLFVAYAEDQGLLPYNTNESYRRRSIKQLAHELDRMRQERAPISQETSYWNQVVSLWNAVDRGQSEWDVPEYDGRLFSSTADVAPIGALIAEFELPNSEFVPILASLLIDRAPVEGYVGPVDFTDLGVREFGTIYEGLLENELTVAETDLTVRERNGQRIYWPVDIEEEPGQQVVVPQGQAYLHTTSGARKMTGSYYTKDFAVQHLLNNSLEPAIQQHLERLEEMDENQAAEAFFDFRVADIAMGSGHFLTAAVDRIERHFTGYLADRNLPRVREELERLRAAAAAALGPAAATMRIEDSQLLRRQIARRCIYGVDINPLAVQLARVAVWIHTFVPGLPLSFLEHNLVQGNSVVGIATIEEARAELEKYAPSLLRVTADELLGEAEERLSRLSQLADADAGEIAEARDARAEARNAVAPAKVLMDVLTAARLDEDLGQRLKVGQGNDQLTEWLEEPRSILHADELEEAREILAAVEPFHFPIAFPEVFLRSEGEGGFGCILGNPPWEEATVEEDRFWARYFPGLHSLTESAKQAEIEQLEQQRPDLANDFQAEQQRAERQRQALLSGPFPGIGSGDPDFYKAFCWRFLRLLRPEGAMGVVLPRSALCAKGSGDFRGELLTRGKPLDLTILINRGHWVFDDTEARYRVGLLSVANEQADNPLLPLRGPFTSLRAFREGRSQEPVEFPVTEALNWTGSSALPMLPDEEALYVFRQLRNAPDLDLDEEGRWRARPHTELHATNDKDLMVLETHEEANDYWPVFKGASFDIWISDRGEGHYYACADPDIVLESLQNSRATYGSRSNSVFSEFSEEWRQDPQTLPPLHPRVVFRDVARADDTRTVRAALIPPEVFVTNTAPYFLWPRGDEQDQAFLLGMLCSIPLDWYARCFVETHLNYHILEPFPIPRPERENPLWQRTVELAGRLAAQDERLCEWAEDVGVECGFVADDDEQEMIHELDAVVSHLYGLTEEQVEHIFATFHENWDHTFRLREVLSYYRDWADRLPTG